MSGSKETEEKQQKQINEAIKKLDISSFIYHKLGVEEVIEKLNTNPKTGLTTGEAEKRI